ncbi:MAG: hypothetical protein WC227_03725 [Patescibacteria group bacterium]|jgi:hypothetical protein
MADKKKKLLAGLDGSQPMSAETAVSRIEACVQEFGVIGVKILNDGAVVRNCPVGTGHRAAITWLRRAPESGKYAVSVTT